MPCSASASVAGTFFTIVELLTVLGIITVLASMMMPALARARSAARLASCANNMRQLGLEHIMAQNDNSGRVISHLDEGPDGYGSWINYLHIDHDLATGVFVCPSSSVTFSANTGQGPYAALGVRASYLMNTVSENYGGGDWVIRGWQDEPSVLQIADPAGVIFITEISAAFSQLIAPNKTLAGRGVRYMGRPPGWDYESDGKWNDTFGGEWLDSNTDHGPPITGGGYAGRRLVGEHHGGGFNALMGDGRVSFMKVSNPTGWIAYER